MTSIHSPYILPVDLWKHVFSYLDVQSLTQVEGVCQEWKKWTEPAWESCCLHDWPEADTKEPGDTWKGHYLKQVALKKRVMANIQAGNAKITSWSISDKISSLCVVGNRLVSGTENGTIQVWDTKTYQCRQTIQEPSNTLECLCVEKEKIYAATSKTIHIWKMESGDLIHTLSCEIEKIAAICLGSNLLFASSNKGSLCIWNLTVHSLPQRTASFLSGKSIRALCVSDDKLFFASELGNLSVYDIPTNKFKKNIEIENVPFSYLQIFSIFKHKGLLYCGDWHGKVHVINPITMKPIDILEGNSNTISSLYAIEDNLFSCCPFEQIISVWNTSPKARLYNLEKNLQGRLQSICGNSHRLFSCNEDKTIRAWDFTIAPKEWKIVSFYKWIYSKLF